MKDIEGKKKNEHGKFRNHMKSRVFFLCVCIFHSSPSPFTIIEHRVYLCSEAEAVTVRVSRRRVVEHTGAVDGLEEQLGRVLVLRDDGLRVARAVRLDVLDGRFHAVHDLQGNLKVACLHAGR